MHPYAVARMGLQLLKIYWLFSNFHYNNIYTKCLIVKQCLVANYQSFRVSHNLYSCYDNIQIYRQNGLSIFV